MCTLQCIFVLWITLGKHNSYNYIYICMYTLYYDSIYLIALHPSCSEPATIGTRHKHRLLSLMMMSHVLTERRTGQMSHGPWQSTLGDWWFCVNDIGDQNQRGLLDLVYVLGFTWFTDVPLYWYNYDIWYIYIYSTFKYTRVDECMLCGFLDFAPGFSGCSCSWCFFSWWVNLYLQRAV